MYSRMFNPIPPQKIGEEKSLYKPRRYFLLQIGTFFLDFVAFVEERGWCLSIHAEKFISREAGGDVLGDSRLFLSVALAVKRISVLLLL